jgi:hypothetical protein
MIMWKQVSMWQLQTKWHDGGVAAKGCRPGRALEIISHDHIRPGRLRDMNMAVDAAGQNQPAGGVDNFIRCSQIMAEGYDAPVANGDVAGKNVRRRRNRATPNDRIKSGHLASLRRLTARRAD